MNKTLGDIFKDIEPNHFCTIQRTGNVRSDLERLVLPYNAPADLVEFYTRYAEVRLFKEDDPPYWFHPVSKLRRTGHDILGDRPSERFPESWFTICDVRDGNYIAVDLQRSEAGSCKYIDCFHETFAMVGYSTVIALSFEEFLRAALDSGGSSFWLERGFKGYGDAYEM